MRTISLLLFLANISGCQNNSKTLVGLDRLKGSWIAHLDESTVFLERWSKDGQEKLKGSGKALSNGKKIFEEQLSLSTDRSNVCYCSRAYNQNQGNEICFRLTQKIVNTYVWSNKSHDFPQTISYTFKGNDSLIVLLKGIEKGKNKQELLRFRRQ